MKLKVLWVMIMLIFLPISDVYGIELIETYKSDNSLFVQGFELIDSDKLLIGTGKHGNSVIGIMDITSGKFTEKAKLDNKYFGEGLTVIPEGIWQITWKEGKAFLRDSRNFKVKKTVNYSGEGWGIAYNKEEDVLLMSDGTNKIDKRNPISFDLIDSIFVYDNENKPLLRINELEFANGYLYANQWYSNIIYKIDSETGKIVDTYDVTEILENTKFSKKELENIDVLNGIAHIKNNEFYITGKNFPVIYRVNLE